MTTTHTKGIEWLVRRDGRAASLHRTKWAASRQACKEGGWLLATSRQAPEIRVGDKVSYESGLAIYSGTP